MIGLMETTDRVIQREAAKYAGRSYRYGSRVIVYTAAGYRDGTVTGCFADGFDYVNQSGIRRWARDSQIVQVLAY